jgi:hypothetical protein
MIPVSALLIAAYLPGRIERLDAAVGARACHRVSPLG